ncbi:MAG: hypothetical protein WCS09_10390 [Pseudomonadota bacterium]
MLHRNQPALAVFALAMLLLALPALAALAFDPRTVHGVATWAKPLKFMVSTALFAATMAWVIGLLPEPVRRSRTIGTLSWLVIGTASFEVGYISLQAALGAPSHYNTSDPFHAAMFGLMGIAAVVLVATQAVLARLVLRHARPLAPLAVAVAIGLVLTCVLSILSGFLLGGLRPPAGIGLPVFGWHAGGDLRPAHFLAVHAQQFLPLAGLALQRVRPRRAWPVLSAFTAAYVAGWAWLVSIGLAPAI